MKNIKRISTEGKTVFVGIDVHKSSYSIAGICEGALMRSTRLPADFGALEKTLNKLYPGATIKTVYEAGFAGFGLNRFLESRGISNIVVNPADILVQANDRVKTDKRDAFAMARQLAGGLLQAINIPAPELEDHRALVRYRQTLVEDRSRTIIRIKSKLHQFGHMSEDLDGPFCKKRLADLESWVAGLENYLGSVLRSLIRTLEHIEKEISDMEKIIAQQAHSSEDDALLRSIPGIGPVASSVIRSEIGNFHRFENRRQLASFCGLAPGEHSSGDKVRKGSITKKGSPRLRKVLVEASWRAIKSCSALNEKFEKLCARGKKTRAIVAIARILILQARACILSGKPYMIA